MGSPDADVQVYAALARAFSALGVRWFLFGAQAAILYGASRFTEDIDVTVDLGAHPTAALVTALQANGFALRVANTDDFVAKTRVIPLLHPATGFPVDIVLAGPGLEELFFERVRPIHFGETSVPLAAAEDLIAMKILAGRAKDIDDVVAILAAKRSDLDLEQVRDTLRLIESALDQSDLLPAFEQCIERSTV